VVEKKQTQDSEDAKNASEECCAVSAHTPDDHAPTTNGASNASTLDKKTNVSEAEDADSLKARGNALFCKEKYTKAIAAYGAAKKMSKNPQQIAALLTNRAACYMKLEKYAEAVRDCEKALKVDPSWLRGYLRKASALTKIKRFEDAQATLVVAHSRFPDNTEVHKLNDLVRQEIYFSKQMKPQGALVSSSEVAALSKKARAHAKQAAALSPAQVKRVQQLQLLNKQVKLATQLEFYGPEKIKKAIAIYEVTAQQGCTTSMVALGRIFYQGEDLARPDHARGVYWMQKCIDHGPSELSRLVMNGFDPNLASAQGMLGQAYRHGLGVGQDLYLARRYLQLGAEGGNSVTMNNLGTFLAKSHPEEAASYYQQAAEVGYGLAMVNLAAFLIQGHGVSCDVSAAEAWLRKAQQQKEPQASVMLADLILARGESSNERVAQLETALRDEKAGGEERASTQIKLASALLQMQEEADEELGLPRILRELKSLEVTLPGGIIDQLEYVKLLRANRPLTEAETRACGLLSDAMLQGHPKAGVQCGQYLLSKGLRSEALTMFSKTAKQHEDVTSLYEAGLLLTTRGLLSSSYVCRYQRFN
jgi:TPR repeat protein